MNHDKDILSALDAIDVADLNYAEWTKVGMALKEEGFPCSVWDEWSRNDNRYHPGECERKWSSFCGNSNPVKGGTIIQMAKDRGWSPFGGTNSCMDWDDVIEYQILSLNGKVSVSDMMQYLNVCDKTVYARVRKMGNEFTIKKGCIYCNTVPATDGNSIE